MPRFAANITTMFQEFDASDRMQLAMDCGFNAVEFLFPYEYSVEEIQSWHGAGGMEVILINTPEPPGCACVPGRQQAFRSGFLTALNYAKSLGAPMIHLMAGKPEGPVDEAEDCFVANVQWASDLAADRMILLEALNIQDMPGYLHSRTDHTVELIRRIGRPNVRLQFDFYHQQLMEGNLAAQMEKHWDHIGHVQFSSVPGRHEPQYGEVNTDYLFDWLDSRGYDGWVGCEYKARGQTAEGLTWFEKYR